MEWKYVRKWLLLMLLLVDLFLAGNLIRQIASNQQAERQAVLDAVTVAQTRGVRLDSEEVLRLPTGLRGYEASRSDQLEQAAAAALLGEGALQEGPGGGVAIYRGETGQLSFRRGGALELDMLWQGETFDENACKGLLEPAGLDMEGVLAQRQGNEVTLTQPYEGYPIVNSRLTCQVQDGLLQVRGRWLLIQEGAEQGESLSRAQLVLALCALLEAREVSAPDSLEVGYYLQSQDAQSLTLVPVLVVQMGQEQALLSCLTGEELSF